MKVLALAIVMGFIVVVPTSVYIARNKLIPKPAGQQIQPMEFVPSSPQVAEAYTVRLSPQNLSNTGGAVGTPFTASIYIESGEKPVNGVELFLTYDPSILSIQSKDIRLQGAFTDIGGLTQAENGSIRIIGINNAETRPVGNVHVADITFTPIRIGTSSVAFTDKSRMVTDEGVTSIYVPLSGSTGEGTYTIQ